MGYIARSVEQARIETYNNRSIAVRMLETLTKELWVECLNEGFIIAGSVEMELVEVNSLGHKHPRAEREPFSLVFRGPKTPVLIQKIYPVEHRSLGVLDLFLVPIGPDQAGMRYEAIFT